MEELKILEIQPMDNGLFIYTFKHNCEIFTDSVLIKDDAIKHVIYGDRICNILHGDVGWAKRMNSVVFGVYKGTKLQLPYLIEYF